MKRYRIIGTDMVEQELDNIDCDVENVVHDFLNNSGVCNVLVIARIE